MSSARFQRQLRIDRLHEITQAGFNPFEVKSKRDYTLYEAKLQFGDEQHPQNSNIVFGEHGTHITLAGRVKSKRVSGKIAFATIEDESLPVGFQLIFRRDFLSPSSETETELDESEKQVEEVAISNTINFKALDQQGNIIKSMTFDQFKTLIDEGDYIQATGYFDRSQRGEPSLFVQTFTILTKSLRSLPEELDYENVESRYLDRVADFKMNTLDESGRSVRDVVRLKNTYWSIWREEMIEQGFLEVECPIFEATPGGAEAKPFTTFYNELNQEMYLRISLELPLKKLIAGGFEKVFEIGRIFRNEGSSPQHLQEYTQIEWYWAYSDYTSGMKLVKKVYQRIVQAVLGGLEQTDYYGNNINWGQWCSLEEAYKNGWGLSVDEHTVFIASEVKELWEGEGKNETQKQSIYGWPIIAYYDAIRHYSGGKIDIEGKNYDQLLLLAKEHAVEVEENAGFSTLVDKIYKKLARVNIHNPIFLALVPVELEPLAKRNPENPNLTERWQIVAGTAELGKCFSELNDPIDQFGRFEDQQKARDNGDEEAQFMDEEYVKALELGTPPMSGFGTSERFLSFLLGKHIKECVTFPHIKKQDQDDQKKKKTMVAHAVILRNDNQPVWSQMNAAAHLSAAFAAREGTKLIDVDASDSADGVVIPMNIQHAIIMKETDSSEALKALATTAQKLKLNVSIFTEDMRNSSDDTKVVMAHSQKSNEQIQYLGVLVFGKKSTVEELTEGFARIG